MIRDYYIDMLKPLGPDVLVLRLPVGKNPDSEANWLPERMPAWMAVDSVMFDPRNGVEFSRARIVWNDVLDIYSSSGSAGAAEFSKIARNWQSRPEYTADLDDESRFGFLGDNPEGEP
jgi:hypothetical protein